MASLQAKQGLLKVWRVRFRRTAHTYKYSRVHGVTAKFVRAGQVVTAEESLAMTALVVFLTGGNWNTILTAVGFNASTGVGTGVGAGVGAACAI